MSKYLRRLYVVGLVLLAIPLLVAPWPGLFHTVLADDDGGSGLVVRPGSLTFTATAGGSAPSPQSVSVSSNSGASVSFKVSSSAAWLTASPTSGTTPATLKVSVNPAGLAAGTYTGYLRLSIPNTEGGTYVSVTLTVATASPTLSATPNTLSFTYQQGGSVPSSQSVAVRSSTGLAVGFTDSVSSGATWLKASPASGTTPSNLAVSVSPSGLAAGTYSGTIALSSSIGSVTLRVSLTISAAPSITVTPTSLAFGFQQGGTTPPAQNLSVSSTSAVSFTATARTSSGGSWVTVTPTSGTTPATLAVSVNPGTLSVGSYSGSIAISSSLGSVTVPVTLTITTSTGSSGSHVLVAWSELGMHCMDGQDYSVLAVLPPYNTIYAKLYTTGSTPSEVTSGVTLTYTALKDASGSINTTSAGSSLSPYKTTPNTPQKTNFWNFVRALLLLSPNPDVGVRNYPVQSLTPQPMTYGSMLLDSSLNLWKAEGIPTVPYDDSLAVNSYPMAQITAKDSSGNLLATATVVLNVSNEMSCANCHAPNTNSAAMPSGGWINVSQYTANQNMRLNILKKHDDLNPIPASVLAAVQAKGYTTYQSSLYQTALNGGALNNPVLCAACHSDNALNAVGYSSGVAGVNPLTADMHTRHASVTMPGSTTTLDNMTNPTNPGCYQCHPGPTVKCQRGAMTGVIPGSTAVTCYGCHGNLSRLGASTRQGWLDEPNCQMCHQNGTTYTTAFTTTDIGPNGTQRTSTDATFATNSNAPSTGFALYRFSTGHGSVECSACHGAQHAEYPTSQPNDQVYSVNLQGYAGRVTECSACHGTSFATSANGGPHGMHTAGSAWVSAHPDYVDKNGSSSCTYCHGSDYRGTSRSMILTSKTLAGHTFPAYHEMNCYDCHNGPSGD
jgi:hypothetical protein